MTQEEIKSALQSTALTYISDIICDQWMEDIMQLINKYVAEVIGEDENVEELYPENRIMKARYEALEAEGCHARNEYRAIMRKRARLEGHDRG